MADTSLMLSRSRRNFVICIVALVGLVALTVAVYLHHRGAMAARSDIQKASAQRLQVKQEQVDVTNFVEHRPCYVAQITVHTAGEPTYSVAVQTRKQGAVVTRLSGESLGKRSDPWFDTDDPHWESVCPAQ